MLYIRRNCISSHILDSFIIDFPSLYSCSYFIWKCTEFWRLWIMQAVHQIFQHERWKRQKWEFFADFSWNNTLGQVKRCADNSFTNIFTTKWIQEYTKWRSTVKNNSTLNNSTLFVHLAPKAVRISVSMQPFLFLYISSPLDSRCTTAFLSLKRDCQVLNSKEFGRDELL